MKNTFSMIMIMSLLVSMLTMAFGIQARGRYGMGDTAYVIDAGNNDTYPLMNPWLESANDWPMFHQNPRHTGHSVSSAPSTNDILWSYATGFEVRSSPAVADGKVYIGSGDGRVYCLDASTGTQLWNYITGNRVSSSPTVADGKVYVGSHDNRVYCLDASTGTLVWSYAASSEVWSSPAVADGKVLVGSFDTKIHCVNATTGEYIWSYITNWIVWSSPAVADGKVYVGSGDSNVYCLNASTGLKLWSYATGSYVFSSPAVADGKVYVGSDDYKIYTFAPAEPDLTVSLVSISPPYPLEGQPTSIVASVANIGGKDANGVSVDLLQSTKYIIPKTEPEDTYSITFPLQQVSIASLPAQESETVTFVWNATEILNVDGKAVEIIVDRFDYIKESNEANNWVAAIPDTSIVQDQMCGFVAYRDGYSFKNYVWSDFQFRDLKQVMEDYVKSSDYSPFPHALTSTVVSFMWPYGRCVGMASTASLYYTGTILRPAGDVTFELTKAEADEKIAAYHALNSLQTVGFFLSTVNLRNEYEKILGFLKWNRPPLLLLGDKTTGVEHAVTVIGAYSVTENVKNVVIYDNSYPGLGYVVSWDLARNTIVWNPLPYNYNKVFVTMPNAYPQDWVAKTVNDFASWLVGGIKRIISFKCPVEVDIVDQYGRLVSSRNGGICEIPGADVDLDNATGLKRFWLPLDLDYNITMEAYGDGNVEVTHVFPSADGGTFSYASINVTEMTLATALVPASNATFAFEVDTDGDGHVDYEASPESAYYDAPWKVCYKESGGCPSIDLCAFNGTLCVLHSNALYVNTGSGWNAISMPTYGTSIRFYENTLYMGGKDGLYYLNGTDLIQVFPVETYAKVLGIYNNSLYVGTLLDSHPTLYYCETAAENPANWQIDTEFSDALNFSSPFGSVDSFAVHNGVMYIGSGGKLYSFNGTDWSIAVNYDDVFAFQAMRVYEGKLYLATRDQGWRKPLCQGGTGFSGRVIEYDGENWTTIFDHDYWIYSLGIYDNRLYAGTANKILTYNGTDWDVSFNTTEGAYYALCFEDCDGKIYVGMGNGYIFADPTPAKADPETIVVPEFPSTIILPVFMALTVLILALTKKSRSKRLY